jgi:YD repeat-containing protein
MATVMGNAGSYNNGDVVFFYGTRNGLVDQLAVDLDGDGNEEILAVNEANDRIKIMVGDNLDRLNRRVDLLSGRAPQAVATGDLNGDGRPEIITANRAGRSISVFSGSLASGYTSTDILVGSAPIDVLTRDINVDGHTDVLVLDDVANAVWVLTGSASGVLSTPVAIALGDKPGKFTVADAIGDGQLDAVITLPDSNHLMILRGIGFQPVAAPIYISLTSSPSDIQVTDLNADGNPDLATTLPNSNVLSVLYGRGNNQFARAQNISVGDKPTRVTLADTDEDGRMDLIVANSGDNTASVIYNRFDPNEVYRYDSDAIDPDNDTLTYSIVDGPGGLIINSQTGALLWAASPDQVGEHTVTLAANDGRGGIATQSFKINVQPARDNALPLIATEPNTKIGAGETFTYQATALDNDRDTLRYSLIDAPPGATIDPTTGKVAWDARADRALSFAPHGINSQGRVEIESHPSLRPASLTAEGWYNFTSLPASNQRTNIIYHGTGATGGTSYGLYNFGNAFLRLELDYPAPTNRFTYSIPFVPTTNRWTHFATTIDDSTRIAKIFVDGVERGSATLPGAIVYNPAVNAQVGDSSTSNFTRAIIDNYRLWNVVRTPAEIAEGLSRQYNGDSRVVLDYRFDEPQTLNVRDFSPAGNHGYRKANGLLPEFVPGLAETGSHQFTIGVEDGRGGSDQQSFTLDIVPELRGTIRGQAFNDLDNNGLRNGSEPALSGRHLFIDTNGNGYPDPIELQTTTDASGNYQFNGLLPGQYPLKVSPVAGFETPLLTPASVTANVNTQIDLAIEQLALSQIRGQLRTEAADAIAYWKVFADLDLDNEQDENEPMTMSDRDGYFAITGLSAGNYTIRTELPAGWAVATGTNGQNVTLAANAISEGNHFTLEPTNTSVTGGLHFVTSPTLAIEARQTFRYASVAIDIQNESITYDLSLAPDGMPIDPATGLVAWRPTIAQVGEHLVILRATSASGSISLHDFTLTVTVPNTAPTLSSPEPMGASPGFSPNQPQGSIPGFPPAYVNLIYAVDLQAQDAESHAVSFQLLTGPSGATLNPTTGHLRWTPTLGDVGSAAFSIELRDSQNATSIVNVNIPVRNSQPSATPFAISLPRTQVGLGQDYLARIQGQDSLGRPLTWSLVTGPTGLIASSTGTLRWTPGNDDLGSHGITVRATNVDGATEDRTFTLQVLGRPVNVSPSITSEPITSTVIGKTYRYAMQATDSDADPLSFALLAAPSGMSIHPSLGTILWTPTADQLGESEVSIQVTDPNGASASQTFKLKVSRSGGPPAIRSVPPTAASVGAGYLYTIAARDAENDPLTYRLLAAPAGMNIVETTGEISWTPAVDQVGLQDVVIQVSDGIGGAVTQAFVIRVATGIPNLPPVINSMAPRFGSVGTLYTYTVQATDPESTTITYSLGQSPVDMSIDPVTGVVQWTPTQPFVGKSVVTLIATDASGGKAVESFELDIVAANSQPTIASTAPLDVAAGALFTYQVLGRDADLDQLIYEITTSPAGATIDSFGKVTWPTTPALIGPHNFAVRVSDPRGGVATQSFTLIVIEDVIPPKVSLIESLGDANRKILPWQGPFTVYARAIDNVAVASLTLTANGQDIPLSAAGTATFTFEEWAFREINATATATDTNGNVTTKTITFDYDFPEGWSGSGTADIPVVAITSPTDTAAVFGMVSITGTASHADFAGYKLSYRRIDETTYTQFFESTTAVVNGQLGVWDTSLLINDEYVIRLEAASNAGVVNVVEHNVGLSGELKLGNFRLSFTDMVIPVAGIPIEITRIYDTLQADREGDFGYGWRLEYRNTDLRVGLPKSGFEDIGIYSPLRSGVKVYLNVPGVGRQGFTFNPDIRVLPGFGGNNLVLARPRFKPDRGVTSSLSTGTSGYLQVNEFGELYAPGGIPYNPASPDFGGAYVLTTKEGLTYRIEGASGKLLSATDLNENLLQFTDRGIESKEGRAIQLQRDLRGRVTRIVSQSGSSMEYVYTDSNLVRVTNQVGEVAELTYSIDRPHYLLRLSAEGNASEGLRAEYDVEGRLSQLVDADGNFVKSIVDTASSSRTITDQLGNSTTYQYDGMGNEVARIDALGNMKFNVYDSANNLLEHTDELRRTSRNDYDPFGNPVRIVDAAGNVSRISYSNASRGLLNSIVDPSGKSTKYQFDARGNVIHFSDSAGRSAKSSYDRRGNVTSHEDFANGIYSYIYDMSGNQVNRIDAMGRADTFTHDMDGRILSRSWLANIAGTNSSLSERFTYDSMGRMILEEDALGNKKSFTFDQNGLLASATNELGHRTNFVYNARGLRTQIVQPDSTTTELADNSRQLFEYDALDRVISETNELGNTNRVEYDELGRVKTRVLSDETPDDNSDNPRIAYEYDAVGQLITIVDANGNRSLYGYDDLGRRILSRDPLGNETRFEFDSLGRTSAIKDPMNIRTQFEFDENGYPSRTVFADGTETRTVHDPLGLLRKRTDQNGNSTLYDYDSQGRLIRVVEANNSVTIYDYDERGNLARVRDGLGRATTYEYDALNRRTSLIRPNGQADLNEYDAVGNRVAYTSFNGDRQTFAFDERNRLTSMDVLGGEKWTLTYLENGLLESESDSNGTTTYQYDSQNRLTSRTTPDGHSVRYTYDRVGNLKSLMSLSGTTTYSHDALNRIQTVRDHNNGLTQFEYNAVSLPTRTTFPNGIVESVTYRERSKGSGLFDCRRPCCIMWFCILESQTDASTTSR